LAADYSQIELRLMAHFSQDEALLDAFKHGQDVHRRTASEVLGIPLEDVTMINVVKPKPLTLVYSMECLSLV
jgi:DNA polymerase I-like protein with 3'-5' exonuclease and polymerase domains